MREKDLEQKLIKAVEELGGKCWKWVSPGTTGVPDRICLFPGGRVLFCEVKRPGVKDGLSTRQKRVLAQLRALGMRVAVIYSEEDIYAVLSARVPKNSI